VQVGFWFVAARGRNFEISVTLELRAVQYLVRERGNKRIIWWWWYCDSMKRVQDTIFLELGLQCTTSEASLIGVLPNHHPGGFQKRQIKEPFLIISHIPGKATRHSPMKFVAAIEAPGGSF
jgi:hypothetical protein